MGNMAATTEQQNIEQMEDPVEYIERVFPLEGEEFKIDPRNVGHNKFRVLFWIKKDVGSLIPDNKVNRSYYVVLKKEGLSWTHEIMK